MINKNKNTNRWKKIVTIIVSCSVIWVFIAVPVWAVAGAAFFGTTRQIIHNYNTYDKLKK